MEKLRSFIQENQVEPVENINHLFNSLHEIITVQDTDQQILWANKTALQSARVNSLEELRGEPCYRIWHGQDQPCESCAVRKALETGEFQELESNREKGRIYLKRAYPFNNKNGELTGIVEIALDITEKKEAEELIEFQAKHDSLTGLPNMNSFQKYFTELISADSEQEIALLILDLDRFSKINDVLGYDKGDQLLKFIPEVIEEHLIADDMIARIGGDKFGMIIAIQDEEKTLTTIKQIMQDLSNISMQSHDVYISTSLGGSIYPVDGNDFKTLMRNADTALKEAKNLGGNSVKFFHKSMVIPTISHLKILKDLKETLDNENEFTLMYQPQIKTDNGRIVGFEALIRWQHPELGLLTPGSFIILAEESGLIKKLDYWVLKTACFQLKDWVDQGFQDLTISVNISAQQFSQKDFDLTVRKVLNQTGLNPEKLELEITEHTAIRNMEFTINMLNRLREIGVQVSIDDFGTGYSSLNYLQQMNVDYLKIDKSFIGNLNQKNRKLVRSIINLAHNLNLKVVAEGVETGDHFQFLRSEGCDYIQGFYFYRPLPVTEIEKILKGKQPESIH